MHIIREENFDKVVHAWLTAEWKKHNYDREHSHLTARIIDNPDFDNEQENDVRLQLLRRFRSTIIDPLPHNTVWHTAIFEYNDIERFFVVPSADWLPISKNSYRIQDTVANIGTQLEHGLWIQEIYNRLPNPQLDPKIIMVASSENSPLTMIEGNHRGAALVKYM